MLESFERPSIITAFLTYMGFYILMFLGYMSQALFPPKMTQQKNRSGYPALYNKFVTFYSLYLYRRIRDCWNYPVCSVPGAEIVLKDRITEDHGWTFKYVKVYFYGGHSLVPSISWRVHCVRTRAYRMIYYRFL